ncbi:hypothetical protein AAIB48_09100 [Paraclostridium benzoelyticum]|uniref:hypothetical protein n=1 Tax=Paraclostridium benzoelyticum TaxID=1629550 RepID=UPI0031CCE19A
MNIRSKKAVLIVSSLLITSGIVVGCTDKKDEQSTNTTKTNKVYKQQNRIIHMKTMITLQV